MVWHDGVIGMQVCSCILQGYISVAMRQNHMPSAMLKGKEAVPGQRRIGWQRATACPGTVATVHPIGWHVGLLVTACLLSLYHAMVLP